MQYDAVANKDLEELEIWKIHTQNDLMGQFTFAKPDIFPSACKSNLKLS